MKLGICFYVKQLEKLFEVEKKLEVWVLEENENPRTIKKEQIEVEEFEYLGSFTLMINGTQELYIVEFVPINYVSRIKADEIVAPLKEELNTEGKEVRLAFSEKKPVVREKLTIETISSPKSDFARTMEIYRERRTRRVLNFPKSVIYPLRIHEIEKNIFIVDTRKAFFFVSCSPNHLN